MRKCPTKRCSVHPLSQAALRQQIVRLQAKNATRDDTGPRRRRGLGSSDTHGSRARRTVGFEATGRLSISSIRLPIACDARIVDCGPRPFTWRTRNSDSQSDAEHMVAGHRRPVHLTDHAGLLKAISADTLRPLVAEHAAAAIRWMNADHGDPWQRAYLKAEAERASDLVMDWLTLESARQPFQVAAVEEEVHIVVGDLPLKVRADRIDRVPGGDLLIDSRLARSQQQAGKAPGRSSRSYRSMPRSAQRSSSVRYSRSCAGRHWASREG